MKRHLELGLALTFWIALIISDLVPRLIWIPAGIFAIQVIFAVAQIATHGCRAVEVHNFGFFALFLAGLLALCLATTKLSSSARLVTAVCYFLVASLVALYWYKRVGARK